MLIHGEVDERFARQPARRSTRAAWSSCAAPSAPPSCPSCSPASTSPCMPSMWWDCAPLMAAECLAGARAAGRAAPGRPRRGRARRGRRPALRRRSTPATSRASSIASPASRACSSACRRASRRRAPFAEYVDELEAYYAGAAPVARAARRPPRPAVTLAGRPRPAHEPLAHQQRGHRAPGARPAPGPRRARRSTRPLPHAADVEVRHQWPPDLRPPRSGRLAVIQPWEFGAIPTEWVEPLQRRTSTRCGSPAATCATCTCDAGARGRPRPRRAQRRRPRALLARRAGLRARRAPALRFLFVGGAIAPQGRRRPARRLAAGLRRPRRRAARDQGLRLRRRLPRRRPQRACARWPTPARVVHLDADLADDEMAALYRACDVLVHPYRGEGFAMPVLEAMASGLPVIHTAGGPTDEFCPPQAGWRIRSRREALPGGRVDRFETAGEPWMLEPDVDAPRRAAARGRRRRRRGARAPRRPGPLGRPGTSAGTRVAGALRRARRAPWPPARRAPLADERELDGRALRVLATPAWRGDGRPRRRCCGRGRRPRAGALPVPAGRPGDRRRARRARGPRHGAPPPASTSTPAPTSRSCASTPSPAATRRCTRAAELYVPLHDACAGHLRLAGAKAATPAELGIRLAARPATHAA